MSDYSYLNSLENTYDAAQEATGGKLPDGRYTAILNEARLYPPDEKRAYPRFSTSWVVTKGEYKGRFLYMNFNFNAQGFPYFKQFTNAVGVAVPHLAALPDRLAEYCGKIGQLTLAEQKNDPRYQNTYFDLLIGTGNVSDYIKPKAAAQPVADSFTPEAEDDEDLPF